MQRRRGAWLFLASALVACGPRPDARAPDPAVRTARLGENVAHPESTAVATSSSTSVAPSVASSAPPAVAPAGSASSSPTASTSASPSIEPPPQGLVVDRAQRLVLGGAIAFREGDAALELASDAWLARIVEHLRDTPRVTRLRIEAHTEIAGTEAASLTLSKARALAVARWLVLHGVDCRRLVPVGFGSSRPRVTPETTPAEREQNRRIELVHAELEGKAYRGLPLDGGGTIAGDACR